MNLTADLAYWITERYSVKLRRAAGLAPPWSPDPIFQTVRFTNVHREDDQVTKWLAEHWRGPYVPVWKIVLARLLNNIPTLEYLNWEWEGTALKTLYPVLMQWRATGAKVFSSAYTVSTCGRKMDKLDYVVFHVCKQVKDVQCWDFSCCNATYQQLLKVDGLGTFLAAQVVADLKNTKGHPLQDAYDWWTFSAPGPGSLKGLTDYYGTKITESKYQEAIDQAYREVLPLIAGYVPRMSAQDFQNCLCEFSKYQRVKRGGTARNRYVPAHNPSPQR